MPTCGAAAVVMHNNQVLLIKRRDLEVWELPGGAIEANESVAQAAIREVFEETGIQIELTRLVGIYSRPQWLAGGDHMVIFLGKPLTHSITVQPEEVLEADYFPPSHLPEPLILSDKVKINDALNGLTGVVRLQDSIWPSANEEDWRKRLQESPLTPSAFYAKYFTAIGSRGDQVEVPGTPS